MTTEFQLIRKLAGAVGDDCSVHRIGNRDVLISVDSLIENVHFKRSWGSFNRFGEKAAAAALSDIAAMGGKPCHAWIALEVSRQTSEKECLAFYRGLRKVFRHFGVILEGGNTTASKQFAAHLTVWGECSPGKALRRDGAQVGDTVFVAGNLGWAALGLKSFGHKLRTSRRKKFFKALLQPKPLVALGLKLARTKKTHACIDASDGLLQDLEHLARASGVHIIIEATAVPMTQHFIQVARALKLNPLQTVLTGGEDYALAFTGKAPLPGTAIGRVIRGKPGVTLLDKEGRPIHFLNKGFRHAIVD